jgi:hypothetical protein
LNTLISIGYPTAGVKYPKLGEYIMRTWSKLRSPTSDNPRLHRMFKKKTVENNKTRVYLVHNVVSIKIHTIVRIEVIP